MTEIVPFVHEGLGNSSYVVALDDGEAFVVDPDRSVKRYLDLVAARGLRLAGVFETHLHADFVSGSRELAASTGATLFVPRGADAGFGHHAIDGGTHVPLPGARMDVLASPGHTPEHVSYVLRREGAPPVLFSGGSLIVGGAARTDLIAPERTGELTRAQYRSIRESFRALPDETILNPTHGGGSFCSTGAGGERTSTLGIERISNPVLGGMSGDEFADWFPATLPAAPAYFFRLRAVNQRGPRLRREISMPRPLPVDEFDEAQRNGVVIDLRPQAEFMRGHIAGSLSNTFRDAFATWLGWLVPEDATLYFVLGVEPPGAVVDECLLVGYERFGGFLAGGMRAWERSGRTFASAGLVDALGTGRLLRDGAIAVDVREDGEFAGGHIPGALSIPLGSIEREMERLPRAAPIVTYCGHGERSASALSVLARAGFRTLANLDGGIGAWEAAGKPTEMGQETL